MTALNPPSIARSQLWWSGWLRSNVELWRSIWLWRRPRRGQQTRGTAGATVRSITVNADKVTVDGFIVTNTKYGGSEDGVFVAGNGVILRDNHIHDTSAGGIYCEDEKTNNCSGIVVSHNTVERNVGVSVEVWGSNVVVEHNYIADPIYVSRDTDTLRVMAGKKQTVRFNYMKVPNINADIGPYER